jgi:hypothetical protein
VTVFDDAIFDLTPSDVTTSGDALSGTTTMSTNGVDFPDGTYDTYVGINASTAWSYQQGWTLVPGTDVGTYFVPYAYYPGSYYTGEYFALAVLEMGQGHAADPADPPTNFLAGVDFGTFDVVAGKNYFVDCEPVPKTGITAPRNVLKAIWKSAGGVTLSTDVLPYSSSDAPGDFSNYLYPLTAPTGATTVTLQMWATPQPYTALSAGTGWAIGRVIFFAETTTGCYDWVNQPGYHATNTGPITSGRRVLSNLGRTVIAGAVEYQPIPSPLPAPAQTTVVGAWIHDANQADAQWAAGWGFEIGPSGSGTVTDPAPAGGSPTDVQEISHVVAMAVTYDEATRQASYYDLSGNRIFQQTWPAELEPRSDNLAAYSGHGMIRMAVWDRILNEAELSEAIFAAAQFYSHDLTWNAAADGESPLTGDVLATWNGSEMVEHKLPVETTYFTTDPGVLAVQLFAVNKIGRSSAVEITF